MERISIKPRPHWTKTVEEQGLTYHTIDGKPYWHETACYRLSSREVDVLELAANELHRICIEAAGRVIERNLWKRLGIPDAAIPVILASWERDDFSLYGAGLIWPMIRPAGRPRCWSTMRTPPQPFWRLRSFSGIG